jgi:enoyl-[acyl-carrier protein] reductase III
VKLTLRVRLGNDRAHQMHALAGKTALVIGAARGIGAAIARRLAAAGCDVAVVYFRSHAAADALCEELRGAGRRGLAVQANVGDPESVARAAERVLAELGRVDIAVSNAASGVLRPAREMTLKHWRWCLRRSERIDPLQHARLQRRPRALHPTASRAMVLVAPAMEGSPP